MNFQEIAILLVAAGFFGIIAKLIKQPILIGYLFAGFEAISEISESGTRA